MQFADERIGAEDLQRAVRLPGSISAGSLSGRVSYRYANSELGQRGRDRFAGLTMTGRKIGVESQVGRDFQVRLAFSISVRNMEERDK